MRVDPSGRCFEDACVGEGILAGELVDFLYGLYQGYDLSKSLTIPNPDLGPIPNSDADKAEKASDRAAYKDICQQRPPKDLCGDELLK